MKKITMQYVKLLLCISFTLLSEIKSNDCRTSIHQIEDNIHALRMNIKNYGASKASYETINRFHEEIKNLCKQNKCCNHSLTWKLNNVKKMSDKQIKNNKKYAKDRVSGNGVPILLPVLTIGAPATMIGIEG